VAISPETRRKLPSRASLNIPAIGLRPRLYPVCVAQCRCSCSMRLVASV